MIELDSEQIILKPIVLRSPPPPSRKIMHRILLNLSLLGLFLFCFYLIAQPKGPIEHGRIGFGGNYFKTYSSQTPSKQIMHSISLN